MDFFFSLFRPNDAQSGVGLTRLHTGEEKLSFPLKLTKEQFEAAAEGCLRIHIAGKGNFPTTATDYTQYNFYKLFWPEDTSFDRQELVYQQLKESVVSDFQALLKHFSSLGEKIVFTFDGDNLQESSPFTLGIKYLIEQKQSVYAFKKMEPNDTHVQSWRKNPYTGIIILGTPPKEYTGPNCDYYVSYGLPLMLKINQPEKDTEITEISGVVDFVDRFNRNPVDKTKPGLIESSMVSELNRLKSAMTDITATHASDLAARLNLFQKK